MDPPNVLLVVLDSARARNCSLYGHDNETTPFLSEFADDAVTFEQARAPSVHSISSHASIFTGYHTEEHDVTEHKSFVRPEATVWHRIAAEHGYETGLFTPNVIVAQTSNLGDVFDTCVGPKRAKFRLFDDALAPLDVQGRLSPKEYAREALGHDKPIRSLLNGVYKKLESRGGSHDPTSEGGDVYVDEFLSWADERSGPWAACLNLMDSHTPFEPDPEYDNWSDDAAERARERVHDDEVPEPFTDAFWEHLADLEPLYDGTIRQADAAVERLVEALDERGLLDETTVVVTSDHGEGFGERTELDPDVRLRHHSWGSTRCSPTSRCSSGRPEATAGGPSRRRRRSRGFPTWSTRRSRATTRPTRSSRTATSSARRSASSPRATSSRSRRQSGSRTSAPGERSTGKPRTAS
ncbi:sulfatase-like hydrolase/transferase [Halosimplex aquaticum]